MSLYIDIRKSLGAFTLDVKLEAENEILALLGASGCGKSMTLKCVAGIEKPDYGTIVLDGRTLFDSKKHINIPPRDRQTGYLFQNYALFPNMTVEENIASGIKQSKGGKKEFVAQKVKDFYLEGLEKHYPSQLSGGQQQRVALARMLSTKPKILMLDEPFSALDSYLRWQLEQDMRETLSKFEGTTLFVSHNRDEVYRLCDRIAVMNQGKVEVCSEKWSLFHTPRTLAACLLTGCKNICAVSRLGDYQALAEGWGQRLTTGLPMDAGITHIGIRAHCLTESTDPADPNRFEAEIVQIIEDTFSVILMVRRKDTKNAGTLRWELGKQEWSARKNRPLTLTIPPKDILLLTE